MMNLTPDEVTQLMIAALENLAIDFKDDFVGADDWPVLGKVTPEQIEALAQTFQRGKTL